MTEITGTCSSKLQSQTSVRIQGQPDHQVGLTVMVGKHKSPDPAWDGSTMTYVGSSDMVGGNGLQTGYFYNVHPNGDVSHGTFEAKVSTSGTSMTVAGKWHLIGGAGTLAKVAGGGDFSAEMTSPTDSEMKWSGAYSLG
jgi:hypothetical protein